MPVRQDSSTDVVNRREALEELIKSDGWKYFLAHVGHEWQGLGYMQRMRTALTKDFGADSIEPKVVDRTAQEVIKLLQWPSDQVRDLKGSVDDE